ncbi:myoD family inhibitor domain-containing protein isoform X2 [Parambassis ranga]|nr:myoD family inhibitor domain-containing protein-like isoform X2 [Parambassis ranga]
MDVTSHCAEGGANKASNQSEAIMTQPTANGVLPHHSSEEAPPPLSHRSEDADGSVIDSSSTNDISRLLPVYREKEAHTSSGSGPAVCAPVSSSFTAAAPPPHHTNNQKRLSSTRSHATFKTDAAHIREVAGDDCCAHCLLACLFCELLSMCSAVGECLACGAVGGVGCCDAAVGCCCCVEVAGEAACTEEACQAVLDCGILEDCCGSSDCLEVCLECCSICFPS